MSWAGAKAAMLLRGMRARVRLLYEGYSIPRWPPPDDEPPDEAAPTEKPAEAD